MKTLVKPGYILFAISVIAFGVVNITFGNFLAGLIPVSPSAPGRQFLMYVVSFILIISGFCVLVRKQVWKAAITLAILFFVLTILVHLPRNIANPYDGGAWTGTFEMIALCAGALILADTLPAESQLASGWSFLIRSGRYPYAISLFVFGIQHFIYADFVATLVPAWIPPQLFWTYFVGIAFIVSAVSIMLNVKLLLAMILLAIMFFILLLCVNLPIVATNPQMEAAWTSAFVALEMGAIALMLTRK